MVIFKSTNGLKIYFQTPNFKIWVIHWVWLVISRIWVKIKNQTLTLPTHNRPTNRHTDK